MKPFKIIVIMLFLFSAFFAINSCNVIKCDNAYSYFSLRYNGQYTGIDTLINVDGYFTVPKSSLALDKFSFYRNGSLMMGFNTLRNYHRNNSSYIQKLNLGDETDSIETINRWYSPGLYKIQNNTIITQVAHQPSSMIIDYYEVWFKILSRDKLLIIKYKRIGKECDYCNKYVNQELVFYPAWRPDSTDNWLRDCLREKE